MTCMWRRRWRGTLDNWFEGFETEEEFWFEGFEVEEEEGERMRLDTIEGGGMV